MKKTFKELRTFSSVVAGLVSRDENFIKTKLGYAVKRFEEINLTSIFKDYNNAQADVRIDHALTDKTTGAILTDSNPNTRGFQYDKQGLKDVMKAEQKLSDEWNAKEFEVEPYFCDTKNLPTDLTEEEIQNLKGLVIELKVK